ncbi:chorismate mutase [Streptococcus sobrinus]|uniref:Chorismate mutase n=1 Tax=Streptococcus sobrinus TaxID=1310 RepID=A0ABM6W6M5_9STRE|nr:chorismate mutase [Streptococcus sobrinus]AWN18479.1 chorismate mutase [Streptococcus sobrinus]AWN21215.1 chorismate mutase [Streptococcus sobrinus]EMP69547.1 hypothetical protein D823_10725 [Streptococcus sobrinus DSM 20742 = ATCC 33478]OZV23157.1 chorismate mutase [Streptococcus sobrinus]SQG14011.1 Chorismate mutase [Streptococcus sobrinus]
MAQTLAEVRQEIDLLDQKMIRLLAERQKLVEAAGRLKPRQDAAAVAAPDRVAQIIRERRNQAAEVNLSPDLAEAVWRSMIEAFILLESKVNEQGES